MNGNVVIVVIASVIIVASVGYSIFNIVTLDQIQIKWNDRGSFDFMTMLNGGVVEVCNSSSIPLSFNGITIATFWEGEEIGRFATNGATVQPNSSTEINGKGYMTSLAANMFSMYIDAEMTSGDFARIDPSSMTVMASVDTTILGVIPFSVTEEYSGQEFFEIMNDVSGNYDC